jgi:hypothetical protein
MATLQIPKATPTETFTRGRYCCSRCGFGLSKDEYYNEGCGEVEGRNAD